MHTTNYAMNSPINRTITLENDSRIDLIILTILSLFITILLDFM